MSQGTPGTKWEISALGEEEKLKNDIEQMEKKITSEQHVEVEKKYRKRKNDKYMKIKNVTKHYGK